MKTKKIVLTSIISLVILASYISFCYFQNDDNPKANKTSEISESTKQKKSIYITHKNKLQKNNRHITRTTHEAPKEASDERTNNPEPINNIVTLDSIKEQIYDIAVEYTDDLPLLDDIIQEGANEPLELWEGDWVSVDDWKRNNDNFSIEKSEDGSYELIPNRDSVRSYSYDNETKEFVWEREFYGKIITYKAKFISEDVMILMNISGIKVALDIYKRDAG